jgi:hypothetical protein
VIATVSANLPRIVELSLIEMGFTTLAFNEDVLCLNHALLWRNGFDSLPFFAKPGHKNRYITKASKVNRETLH